MYVFTFNCIIYLYKMRSHLTGFRVSALLPFHWFAAVTCLFVRPEMSSGSSGSKKEKEGVPERLHKVVLGLRRQVLD